MKPMSIKTRLMFAAVIFTGSYLATITVNAQPVVATTPSVQVGEENVVSVSGSITEVGNGFLTIDVNGKPMRVDLRHVDLQSPAQSLFQAGMMVGVIGNTEGNSFGMPVIAARSINAAAKPVVRKID